MTDLVLVLCFVFIGSGTSCDKAKNPVLPIFKTENIVILVMDGARYSETWGDESHEFIPRLADDLADKGVINTSFKNLGHTLTVAGHTALTTGSYQAINNSGHQLPDHPSLFQYWRELYDKSAEDCWVLASKGTLDVLSDCDDQNYTGHFRPSSDCGEDGAGVNSGFRNDSLTYLRTIEVLSQYHPSLVLVNFKEPDDTAHLGDWEGYLEGIVKTDQYLYDIIDFLEQDPIYSGRTTVFVTNDHGLHLDGVGAGFSSHGDECDGCQHILFYAMGPDFKSDEVIDVQRSQVDIPATAAYLLNLEMPYSEGEVMSELFE